MVLQAVAPVRIMNDMYRSGKRYSGTGSGFDPETKNDQETGEPNASVIGTPSRRDSSDLLEETMEMLKFGRLAPGDVREADSSPDTKAEAAEAADAAESESGEALEVVEMIRKHIDELMEKIEDGDTEPRFQLGARSYTIREWEDFLKKFDSVQDAIRQMTRAQIEERIKRETGSVEKPRPVQIDMILSDTVEANFPLQAVDQNGNRMEDTYLIAFDREGIRCSRPGSDTYEWEIRFTEDGQYEKVREFLDRAGELVDNFLFASNENFWKDFLGGKVDVEKFQEFLSGTNNGIPDYGVTVNDSTYIDRDKARWAKYMNSPGAKMYTAQEMAEMVAEEIRRNQAGLTKLTAPYEEVYRKYHPQYRGEAIFCEYPGGPLYTANEIGQLMYERALRDNPELRA